MISITLGSIKFIIQDLIEQIIYSIKSRYSYWQKNRVRSVRKSIDELMKVRAHRLNWEFDRISTSIHGLKTRRGI